MEYECLTTQSHDSMNNDLAEDRELNITSLSAYTASVFVWRYCPPVLLVIGTFGNVATIFVYQRMKWGDCTQPLFLTALAVADLCVLYSGLVPDISYHVFGLDLRGLHDVTCKLSIWILDSSACASTWLLVALTTQRAVSVTCPHRVTLFCSKRKSRIAVLLIVLFAVSFESHQLFGLEVHDTDVYFDGACAASKAYEEFWAAIWPWVEMTFNTFLPSVVLVVTNALLVCSLRRSAARTSSSVTSNAAGSRKKVASSLTVTVIAISVMFLILGFPIDIVIITWDLTSDRIQNDVVLMARMKLAWAIGNMMWYANSAVNFLLYCLSGSKFREEFARCLKGKP